MIAVGDLRGTVVRQRWTNAPPSPAGMGPSAETT